MKTLLAFIGSLLLLTSMFAQGPDAVAGLLNQGETLVHDGKLDQAQEFFQRALLKFPRNAGLRFDLGMVFFLQHNWPKAIENYRKSLLIKPDQVDPLYYMAQAYFQSSDLDRAREAIAQAATLAPDNPDVCEEYGEYLAERMDKRTEGLEWLEKARTLNPSLERIDFEIGLAQFNLNDFQGATVSFQAALKKDPANGEAAFLLGDSWSGLGDWEKARDSYDDALAKGYSSGAAYYGLGTALVQLGSYAAALTVLEKALELNPSLKKVHFQLAKAYRQLGRLEEAQRESKLFEILNQAQTSATEYAEFQTDARTPAWSNVKALLEENKEQAALDYIAKLPSPVRNNAQSQKPNPYYVLGIVFYTMGRIKDGERVLEIARAQMPGDARTSAYLGVVELAANEPDQAEKSFNLALTLDPTDELALIGLARMKYKQQQWQDVIAYLERSHTANAGALYLLCDAYLRVGRINDASIVAEAIRSLAANDKNLLNDLDQLVKQHQPDQPTSGPK